jgi:metal-responsive CopG/Arc/MetJ family transcriptional regulator
VEGGSMPKVKHKAERISLAVPAAMVERLEAVAPTTESRRSEFIRQAVEQALDQAEREAPDPTA